MKTVPLYGKKAAGRVALVDDEDYELAMRFRWNVWEERRPSGSVAGPYARTTVQCDGKKITVSMHQLITGYPQTDHINHDGLDNQRTNLRPATHAQNMANARLGGFGVSQYRGVYKGAAYRTWGAYIMVNRKPRRLGRFASEVEAALAYDAAALEARGEFALLNFPPATRVVESAATRGVQRGAFIEMLLQHAPTSREAWWARREPTPHICTVCGREYPARSTHPSLYCDTRCRARAARRRKRERELRSSR